MERFGATPLKLTAKASEDRLLPPEEKRLYSNRIHFQVAFAVSSREGSSFRYLFSMDV